MLKIAFVIARYAKEINGLAENHCRVIAESLSNKIIVEVLTSCSKNIKSWVNVYKEGSETINDVLVRRFPTIPEKRRLWSNSNQLPIKDMKIPKGKSHHFTEGDQPNIPSLIDYIGKHKDNYNYFIFFDYRYATTLKGMPLVWNKSILIPELYQEPFDDLELYDDVFQNARRILYDSEESLNIASRAFSNEHVPCSVIGLPFEEQPKGNADDFKKKYKVFSPYLLLFAPTLEHKGYRELINYFMRYKENYLNDLKLVIFSPKSELSVENSILIYLDNTNDQDLYNALSGALALINPSPYESLFRIAVASWIEGAPLIANGACRNSKDLVRSTKGGKTFDNQFSFNSAINYYYENEKRKKSSVSYAKAYLTKKYDKNIYSSEFLRIISNESHADDAVTFEKINARSITWSPKRFVKNAHLSVIKRCSLFVRRRLFSFIFKPLTDEKERSLALERMRIKNTFSEKGIDLSVILSTSNRIDSFKKCYQSLHESYIYSKNWLKDVEIIVCDDGGQDATLDFIRKQTWDFQVKYIYQQNESFGLAANRNQGLIQSKGKNILFLDSDCIVEKPFLSNILRILENNKLSILIPERCYLTEEYFDLNSIRKSCFKINITDRNENVDIFYRYPGNVVANWQGAHGLAFALSRSIAESVGLFDESFTSYGFEDTDYFFRAYKKYYSFHYSRKVRVYHQKHSVDNKNAIISHYRFKAKHYIEDYQLRQKRIYRVIQKIERGHSLNLLINRNSVNVNKNDFIDYIQKGLKYVLDARDHSCCVAGKNNYNSEYDLVLNIADIAESTESELKKYRFFPKVVYLARNDNCHEFQDIFDVKNYYDIILAADNQLRESCIANGVPQDRIAAVPFPLSICFFQKQKQSEKVGRILGNMKEKFIFLTKFQSKWLNRQPQQIESFISTFFEEFKDDRDVILLALCSNINSILSLENKINILGFEDRFRIVDEDRCGLSENHFSELFSRIHCYIFPFPENTGSTLLAAMSMGTPSIGLAWGSAMDFMPFYGGHAVKIKDSIGIAQRDYQEKHCNLLLPDTKQLKNIMRKVYSDYYRYKKDSLNYITSIHERYHPENIAWIFERAVLGICRNLLMKRPKNPD